MLRVHAVELMELRMASFEFVVEIEFFFVDHFASMPSYTQIFQEIGLQVKQFQAAAPYGLLLFPRPFTGYIFLMADTAHNWNNTST